MEPSLAETNCMANTRISKVLSQPPCNLISVFVLFKTGLVLLRPLGISSMCSCRSTCRNIAAQVTLSRYLFSFYSYMGIGNLWLAAGIKLSAKFSGLLRCCPDQRDIPSSPSHFILHSFSLSKRKLSGFFFLYHPLFPWLGTAMH